MEMEGSAQHQLCYLNPNYWYEQYQQQYGLQVAIPIGEVPIGSSTHNNPKSRKRQSPAVTKMCLLVSFVIAVVALLLLTGVVVGLYYAFKPNRTTTMTTTTTMKPESLLWPYGPDAGDEELSFSQLYSDSTAPGLYRLFGEMYPKGEFAVSIVCSTTAIQAADMVMGRTMRVVTAEPPLPGYDSPDPATERFCYGRKTSSDADKERLCRLIGGDAFTLAKPFEAYVATFTNYASGDQHIGTFQTIFVVTDPKTYIIRSYETISEVPNLSTGQFPVLDFVNDIDYETSTVAADVRGKTQVFDLTEAGTAPNLNDATPSTASGCA